MRYYIIAGEASGDLHAANLMKALKGMDAGAEFRFWGGDRMQEQGGALVKHYRDLAYMGFVEVVQNIRTILKNIRFCKTDLVAFRPDALILVDYPGFNLRIAEFAKKQGFKVFYYISPQVWAWKQSRVKKIKHSVDRMLTILPFEKDFYAKFGVETDFVGHPLLDAIAAQPDADPEEIKNSLGLGEKPVVALLPGSRKQEIATMLPIMLEAVESFPEYEIVVAAATSIPDGFYEPLIAQRPVKIIRGNTYNLLRCSTTALVTSGTATLETALFNVPQVVCYKGSAISYQIARRLVKVDYIALVNLIMGREVVKELIQRDLNPVNLKKELSAILEHGERRNKILGEYEQLKEKLGGEGASRKAAGLIFEDLKPK